MNLKSYRNLIEQFASLNCLNVKNACIILQIILKHSTLKFEKDKILFFSNANIVMKRVLVVFVQYLSLF